MNPQFYEQSIYDKGGNIYNGEQTEWKKLFANYISDMKLIAKYTKNLLESTSKTKQNKTLDLKTGREY